MRAGRPVLVAAIAAAVTAAALAAGTAAAGRAASAPVWSGTWDTSRGPLTLAVAGSAVTGTFGYSDSRNEPTGKLEGVVSGSGVTGTWHYDKADFAPMDNGPFSFAWGPAVGGKATFTGQMIFKANSSSFDWPGTCKAGACLKAGGTPPIVKVFGGTATAGKVFELRFRIYDDGSTVSHVVTVTQGAKTLYRKAVPTQEVKSGLLGFREWAVPKGLKGAVVLTVVAKDDGGLTTKASATITVR